MTRNDDGGSKLAGFEAATRVPMLIVSLAVVPVYFCQALTADDAGWIPGVFAGARLLIHVAMAADVVIRTYLAPRRISFLATHKLDIFAIAVPPLRTLREFAMLRSVFRRPGLARFSVITLAAGVSCALVVYVVEHDREGASITTVGDALWWAGVTATTIGYGDEVPVTTEGRTIAFVLILLGVTLFAVLTAHIAAHFVGAERSGHHDADIADRLRHIEHALIRIQDHLDEAQVPNRSQSRSLARSREVPRRPQQGPPATSR